MKKRLQKIISEAGITSRRAAEKLIAEGKVTVNGKVAQIGDSADPDIDIIEVSGNKVLTRPLPVYLVLNKPKGYVTTLSDEKNRKTVLELVSDIDTRVFPVGRLDINSEGLLIMTNDGETANRIMHPKGEVPKRYEVTVQYEDLEASINKLSALRSVDGAKIAAPIVSVLKSSKGKAVLLITIFEGRNRQIRKMCAASGLYITRLVRVSEGEIALGDLPVGKWRYLTEAEKSYILSI